jgi:uncharacterized protein YbjT (DUF2867 family)
VRTSAFSCVTPRARSLQERGAALAVGDLRDHATRKTAVDDVDAVVHLGGAFRGVPDDEAVALNETAKSPTTRQ